MPASLVDGIATGLGFALVLTLLGSIREIIGQGTLLADANLLFGPDASNWQFIVLDSYNGLLVALLPPGAFIILGLLLAARNLIAARSASTANPHRFANHGSANHGSADHGAANHGSTNHRTVDRRQETPIS